MSKARRPAIRGKPLQFNAANANLTNSGAIVYAAPTRQKRE